MFVKLKIRTKPKLEQFFVLKKNKGVKNKTK